MKISRIAQAGALAAVAALTLAACSAPNEGGGTTDEPVDSSLSGTLDATGASSQAAGQEAWVAGFQSANPDVTINYEPTGSGTGRENFIAGASNFIGSDRAFNEEELAGSFGACAEDGAAGIVQLPLYISPIAVAFNLEGIDSLNMSADTIAGIFAEEITNWNDEAIAADNPDVELPDLAISPVHRADDSGTTDTFTLYLAEAAPDVWSFEPDGVWPLQSGESAQGTSGVVDATRNGNGTIVYADASQVEGLGTVSVKVGEEFVPYSAEAAAMIIDSSPFLYDPASGDLSLEVDYTTTEAGVYPIALVSYLIACKEYEDANTAELVSAYFTYMASPEGQDASAANAGSAPISDSLRTQVDEAIALIG
ncbi:phosphate ABC transporter substrate-binding protein PstS [Microbacterium awajiense]|uniref:Phosphate-binding protein n=1 Tax=Microbacterium awajiense TaxID=415214 RepID=A0ABP7AZ78_9MICO